VGIWGDIWILTGGDELVIGRGRDAGKEMIIPTIPDRYTLWDKKILEINSGEESLQQIQANKDHSVAWIDGDLVQLPLKVRTMKNGDRFYPLNFKGSKKLSDFFTDIKIPLHQRERIPILESENRIIWICGLRLDDRFKVTENTTKMYKLKLGRES
jgi:tRNA(Ile)-lysidine synthase